MSITLQRKLQRDDDDEEKQKENGKLRNGQGRGRGRGRSGRGHEDIKINDRVICHKCGVFGHRMMIMPKQSER